MKQAAPIDLSQAPAPTKAATGERAMFAGGCFWGTQYSFQSLPGVTRSIVGYSGGHTKNPTYRDVCGHGTGHAEAVYLEYDPKKLSYRKLVDYFWTIHDPTTMNRQGPDFGDQYRSAIFYTSNEQKAIAEDSKKAAQASGRFSGPIVTQIVPAGIFYPAEEYHQNYDVKNGSLSCPSPVHK
ncbi:MAG: peptide-methionine (S)-S-oxide reductase MsrA [Cyanobacteria bacterium REEB67]|nr:peptide-methionine (S)-S-oxide reductase MsrA [Cyanobacteria bacterium REEB67]